MSVASECQVKIFLYFSSPLYRGSEKTPSFHNNANPLQVKWMWHTDGRPGRNYKDFDFWKDFYGTLKNVYLRESIK